MALDACLNFELPGCDFLEPMHFLNRHGGVGAAASDDNQRGVVATNFVATRRLLSLLTLPSRTREPYAAVVRLLDDNAHRASVSESRRPSHPCPIVLAPDEPEPMWLTVSLRVLVSQLLLHAPKQDIWVFDHLVACPLTPSPPVFRLPFEVSDLTHIVGRFYQPRVRSQWLRSGRVQRARVNLTQTQSNWFYARLSAFAFYAYCTNLPHYATWGALRLFFDRVETIVGKDRNIDHEAFKMKSANPALYESWSRWNEHMALYAHWFVAFYQVMERCSSSNLGAVKALVGGVVVEVLHEPFLPLRTFMCDAREYWPAMYSCQAEYSSLEPMLVPLQRMSRHEVTTMLQSRLCRRDMSAFANPNMPDEDLNCGSVCYRLPDMLPSHMRATLEYLGFEADDVNSVIMAPYFNGADTHTYDLFVRMHARHECAWQVASLCDIPRAARPLLQRIGCLQSECVTNRPSVLRMIQRAVLRLVNTDGSLQHPVLSEADVCDEITFLRNACGESATDFTPALVFFSEAGLLSSRTGHESLRLQTPLGSTDAQMERSLKKWSAALGSLTTPGELMGSMTRGRFREIVRATAPLLDTVQHLRLFVMFACANPRLGDDGMICVDLQDSVTTWPHEVVTKAAPSLRLTESALAVVFGTQSVAQLTSMLRVIETLNAMLSGVRALADPLVLVDGAPVLQNVAWHQTENDFRTLREHEAQARSFGLRSRPAPVATRSLALFPDQCAIVCASMRDCANGDDLVAELLLGPDAKMNWDPTSSSPDFYRIAQPASQIVTRAATVTSARQSETVAEARSKTHFGDASNPNPRMRPSYPERSTQLMTAEEVRIANDQQSVGRPSSRATKAPPPPPPPPASAPTPSTQPPTAKSTATKNIHNKTAAKPVAPPPPPPVVLPPPLASNVAAVAASKRKAPTQFNGSGRVVKPKPAGAEEARSGNHKRVRDLPLTAGMLDFMLMNEP